MIDGDVVVDMLILCKSFEWLILGNSEIQQWLAKKRYSTAIVAPLIYCRNTTEACYASLKGAANIKLFG